MNKRIEQILGEIGDIMQSRLAKRDFDSVTQISGFLARVQQLRKRATELDGEVSEIEMILKKMNGESTLEQIAVIVPDEAANEADTSVGGRIGPQTLRIEIDWEANGKNRAKETILQPMASDSMVMFLGRLVEELGQEAIQKLSRIRVNRGPLISKSPKTDYLNQAQGKVYSHKRLGGTEYFVLTHSQTSQKADDLSRVGRVLGFIPGSVRIHAVDRAEYYNEKYA